MNVESIGRDNGFDGLGHVDNTATSGELIGKCIVSWIKIKSINILPADANRTVKSQVTIHEFHDAIYQSNYTFHVKDDKLSCAIDYSDEKPRLSLILRLDYQYSIAKLARASL